jgi:hypothetical protein
MADALALNVLKCFNKHMEKGRSNSFLEFLVYCNVLEHSSSFNIFVNNNKYFLFLTALFMVDRFRPNIIYANYIGVIETFENTQIIFKVGEVCGRLLESFYGIKLAI